MLQQPGGHFGRRSIGPHENHAGDAQLGADVVLRVVGAETRMGEPDRPALVDGKDQPTAIEIRLGEHQLLEQIGRHRL